MFASVIQYKLNPIFEQDFLKLWDEQRDYLLSEKIISTSVLHRETKISYVAYTRWHKQAFFEQYFIDQQGPLQHNLERMRECCNSISIPYRLHTL